MVDEKFKKQLEGSKVAGYGKLSEKGYSKIEKVMKGIDKIRKENYKKKLSSKKILKTSKMSVHIKEREIPSVLNDEQRFFKGEFNKEKKRLFLS